MKCNFLICSESVSVDVSTNRLSVFHIIDEINIINFPGVMPMMSISSVLEKEAKDDELVSAHTTMMLGPDTIFDIPLEVRFQGHTRTRNVTNLGGILFQLPGEYEVAIRVGQIALRSWTIHITSGPPQVYSSADS